MLCDPPQINILLCAYANVTNLMGIGADLLGIADIRHASKHRRIAQIVHIRLVVLQLSNVYVLASMESSFGIALTQQHACCKWKSV